MNRRFCCLIHAPFPVPAIRFALPTPRAAAWPPLPAALAGPAVQRAAIATTVTAIDFMDFIGDDLSHPSYRISQRRGKLKRVKTDMRTTRLIRTLAPSNVEFQDFAGVVAQEFWPDSVVEGHRFHVGHDSLERQAHREVAGIDYA